MTNNQEPNDATVLWYCFNCGENYSIYYDDDTVIDIGKCPKCKGRLLRVNEDNK